jgi:hypothetical protein
MRYSNYYSLKIRLNKKFPRKELFGEKRKVISQRDFPQMVEYIEMKDKMIALGG